MWGYAYPIFSATIICHLGVKMSTASGKVLVLNCGSSSIKCAIIDAITGLRSAEALVERIGSHQVQLTLKSPEIDRDHSENLKEANYQQSFIALFAAFSKYNLNISDICAVAHRVVHGGAKFKNTTLINNENIAALKEIEYLAPLHNPANLAGIDFMRQKTPDIPQFMTFDTAFHSTIPDYAHIYPVPFEYYKNLGVRKYGFHGPSHQFVSAAAVKFLNLQQDYGIITAHLGNGCSLCAVQNGISVDTTMGLTPLDGVMMGTRSGSIDPSIPDYLQQQLNLSLAEIIEILNKKSGLLGVSGVSHDLRDVQSAAKNGNSQARCAIEMFAFSISKAIYAMSASLPYLNALVFTGGIGENGSMLREKIISRCAHLGLMIDKDKNNMAGDDDITLIHKKLSSDSAAILVIKTNEEWQLAKEAINFLEKNNT